MKKIVILGHKPVAEEKRTDIIIADDYTSAIQKVIDKGWLHEELTDLWGVNLKSWQRDLIERANDIEFITDLLSDNDMIILEKNI